MEYFTAIWLDLNGGSPLSVLSALHKVSLIACAVSLLTVVWVHFNDQPYDKKFYEEKKKRQPTSF